MSSRERSERERLALLVPDGWERFLRSGRYVRTSASVHGGGTAAPVDLLARVEFVGDHRLAIDLSLEDFADQQERPLAGELTERERSIVALIAGGQETQEIASTLHISASTVRTHVRNAMAKLGAHTRAQLVALAMKDAEQLRHPDDHLGEKSPG